MSKKTEILHTRHDGQVFCVEWEEGSKDFQAVYPSDLADLSYVYPSLNAALSALRTDLATLGVAV